MTDPKALREMSAELQALGRELRELAEAARARGASLRKQAEEVRLRAAAVRAKMGNPEHWGRFAMPWRF